MRHADLPGRISAILLAALAVSVAIVPAARAQIAFRAAAQGSSPGASTITYVAAANATGAAVTSLTIARPAGVAANDVLVAQVTLKGVVAAITAPAAPNDWTLLDLRSSGTAGAQITQAIYWRLAGGAEPANYTWSWTGTRVARGAIGAYRGVEPTAPIDAWGAQVTNNNATITAPSINTTTVDTLLVAVFGSSRASTHSTPGGMTERYDLNAGAGTAGVTISAATQARAATGATGARTSTIAAGAADNIGHLIALRARASLTIAVPAGTVTNDVMVAGITMRPCSGTSGAACTTNITPPAGWTLVDTVDQRTGAGTGGYGSWQYVYVRVASATEPASYTWLFGGTPELNGAAGGIVAFSGVDTASPVVVSADQATGNAYTHTAPSINTGTVTNTMLVAIFGVNSSGTWTRPPGMTEAVDAASLTVPDDLGISLEMSYEARPAAGATGTRTATLSNPPNSDTGTAGMLALRPGVTGPDHYQVTHATSAVNCQAENVTIVAHTNTHTAVSLNNSTTITVSAQFVSGAGGPGNRGDWTLVSGGGVLNNAAADDGVANYTFASGGESTVVLALKNTWAQTVNIAVSDGVATDTSGTASADPGYNQNLTFGAAGFRFVDTFNSAIPNQVAGVTSGTVRLQAIESSACAPTGACTGVCTAAGGFGAGSSVSVELASECVNPTTCQAGQLVSITNNGTSTIAANNSGSVSAYTAKSLLFGANGAADFTLNYPDVGAIRLHARYNIPLATGAASSNFMTGASAPFVVKPYSFQVSSVLRDSDGFANPGAANAAGAAFIRAGDPFRATVTAVNFAGNATPNYGRETAPEGARLIATLVGGLGLTSSPALTNPTAFGAFGAGSASGTTFSWGEVGIVTLSAGVADSDYLGAGDVATFTQSGNVGRFIPHHFTLAPGLLTNRASAACAPPSTFSYMGEGIGLSFTLTAVNAAGVTTQNYASASGFAKLPTAPGTLAPASTLGYGAVSGTSDLSARIDTSVTNPITWNTGVANVAATIAITRAGAPDGPYPGLSIGIAPSDQDAVTLAAASLNLDVDGAGGNDHALIGTTEARFGRLRVFNAVGSQLADLPVPLETQYFNGVGFVTNGEDSCTTLAKGALIYANFQRDLAACETGGVSPPGTVSFNRGKATFTLAKPGPGSGADTNAGSVDLKPRLSAAETGNSCVNGTAAAASDAGMPWLQYQWSGSGGYDRNPSGRASFGQARNSPEFIYFRENY
jgi:hypothetical protein